MNGRKHIGVTILLVLAASLISASLTVVLLTNDFGQAQYQMLEIVCRIIAEKQPETMQTVLDAIKEYKNQPAVQPEESILSSFGYGQSDFWGSQPKNMILSAGIGFAAGAFLIVAALWCRHKKETSRIKGLTRYLEKINTNGEGLLLEVSEDEVSKLQDEMYKTVTTLYQTRDAALDAKKNFADNLANIAHQLKTPITAISLATQMIQDHPSPEYPIQIQIWDEGQGFAKEDIPHIFERFYRGKNAKDGGIGIGIPLAKAIIEMQNGMVSAINRPGGGACFEIRIYSH